MRLLIIVGVRPQLVKVAPLLNAIGPKHEVRIIHTGQHYDDGLSGQFFREFKLPAPVSLRGIRQESRVQRLATTMLALESWLNGSWRPDTIIVIGDSDPAYAGAITATTSGTPVAHIEAGLRSLDDSQLEERNRRVIDTSCTLHFAPTQHCLQNLEKEGIRSGVMSGDLHLDAFLATLQGARELSPPCLEYGIEPNRYILLTAHRHSALTSPPRLQRLVAVASQCPLPVIWPIHPGAFQALREMNMLEPLRQVHDINLVQPQSHGRLISLALHSRLVMTDSGGLQREAYFLGKPCVVLRSATEFPETLGHGLGHLALDDYSMLEEAIDEFTSHSYSFEPNLRLFGDGHAARRIADTLTQRGL